MDKGQEIAFPLYHLLERIWGNEFYPDLTSVRKSFIKSLFEIKHQFLQQDKSLLQILLAANGACMVDYVKVRFSLIFAGEDFSNLLSS
jgi:hypothetical protein